MAGNTEDNIKTEVFGKHHHNTQKVCNEKKTQVYCGNNLLPINHPKE